MSDDSDAEKVIENFQKALETLSNVDNIESLLTKLQDRKNKKLLKKVKSVVNEVHNKVGNIKEKVSKTYKKVKTRSNSESDDLNSSLSLNETSGKDENEKGSNSTDTQEQNKNDENCIDSISSSDSEVTAKRNSRSKRESNNSSKRDNSSIEKCLEKETKSRTKGDKKKTKDISSDEDEFNKTTDNQDPLEIDSSELAKDEEKDKSDDKDSDTKESDDDLIEGTPVKKSEKRNVSVLSELNKSKSKNLLAGEVTEFVDESEKSMNISRNKDVHESSESNHQDMDVSEETEQLSKSNKNKKKKTQKDESESDSDTKTGTTTKRSSRNKSKKSQEKEFNEDNEEENVPDENEESRGVRRSSRTKDKKKYAEKSKEDNEDSDSDIDEMKDEEKESEKLTKNKPIREKGSLETSDKANIDKSKEDNDKNKKSPENSTETSDNDSENITEETLENPLDPDENLKSKEDPIPNRTITALEELLTAPNVKEENSENSPNHIPKIKLVDISKLMAPNVKPMDVVTPSPKPKKSVTFDSSVIILSSSDEDTPKKVPKDKDQSPLKSAMRKGASKLTDRMEISSDSEQENRNSRTRKSKRLNENENSKFNKKENSSDSSESDDSDDDSKTTRSRKAIESSKEKLKKNKKLAHSNSDDSDSDFETRPRTRTRGKDNKSKQDIKSRFSALREERNKRNINRKKKKDDSNSENSDEEKSKKSKNKNKKPTESDSEEEKKTKTRKRTRKKELLEENSLSENSSDSDDSDEAEDKNSKKKQKSKLSSQKDEAQDLNPKKRERPKPFSRKNKFKVTEGNKNDPKFKEEVYIRLPWFMCEELPEVYKNKKEIFEIKKLTNVTMRKPQKNDASSKDEDTDKPENKKIKLTLRLKKPTKETKNSDNESSNDSIKSKENNEELEPHTNDDNDRNDKLDGEMTTDTPADLPDCAVNPDLTAMVQACLDQIMDNSDKEKDKKSSAENESETETNEKNKKGKKSNEENCEKQKKEEPSVNGKLSDSDEDDNNKEKNNKSDSSDEEITRKNKKDCKKNKLLSQKIDSESDEDSGNVSKKKNRTRGDSVRKAKRRIKKPTVISDSDTDEEENNKKKKKKGKQSDDEYECDKSDKSSESDKSASDAESEKEEEPEKKKPARKRIKRARDSSSDDEDKSTRKHIRKMIDRDSLSESTKKAEEDEKIRKARIAEKQKKYNQLFDLKADATVDKVILDFDEKKEKPLLTVHKKIVKHLKPHQVQGIKFMWDACFESLSRAQKEQGSGCILAHCMGLGKTLQVIALVHTLLTHSEKTKVEKVLVVCPVNTVINWKNEFKKWMPKDKEVEVYELVSIKTTSINHERNFIVKDWHENGGVLIIGYNMYRMLSNPENKTIPKKLRSSFQEGLVDPGPDLVVCDEGHLLKNEKTSLSVSMNRIKTARRIVLTGTPLQNNLREYWCMVQFIKPNLLGTYKEYLNRFVNPITNGQYTDSTQHDIQIMRKRSHVLHKLLDGVVQRQDYSVLEPYLPPKHEYVLFLQLTEVQVKLYSHYLDHFAKRNDGSNKTSFLFTDFQALQRMCTHPRVLMEKAVEDKDKFLENSDSEGSLKDFIDDDSEEAEDTPSDSDSSSGSGSGSDSGDSIKSDKKKSKRKKKSPQKPARLTRAQRMQKRENGIESDTDVEILENKEWFEQYINKDEMDNLNHSAKIFLLFEILRECEEIGDKILVFSQSLYTLNCIEYFLRRIDETTQNGESEKMGGHTGSWAIGLDYFRLDGSSSCDNRASWCDQFNDPDNIRARLFLISTKAGGLGINLVAANRVIIFDVSWNPSHDIQSIYRVYRFGQTKPCYIYRFVSYGTMEMKIYERQVTKQAISKRVIDEQQIDRHYSQNDIQELYKTDLEPTDRPIPLVPKDVLLGEMLQKYEKTIFKYHEHQTLLENKQDEELNEEERKSAWEEFENEKVLRKNTVTTGIGSMVGRVNMGLFQNNVNFSPQLIQIALANIVRKDNPTWSEVQIRGILPALVSQLQMQIGENDFSMFNRVQNEIRIMQALQAQRMQQQKFLEQQRQMMLQRQYLLSQQHLLTQPPLDNTGLGNMNITPEELRALQLQSQMNLARGAAGPSDAVIELND